MKHANGFNTAAAALAAFAAAWSAAAASAQPDLPPGVLEECATVVAPRDVPKIRELQAQGAWTLVGAPDACLEVPLAMHVVRRSNGSGGLPQTVVDQCVADANLAYAPMFVSFSQSGATIFIDDDALFDITGNETDILRRTQVVPNAINIYFVNSAPYCGISSFTFSAVQGIVMNNSCTPLGNNHSTFPHEIGHYVDLFHTHEAATGTECVARTNCTTAGDLLCDTPADPGLSNVVNLSCVYTGNTASPCTNDPPYAPDTSNYMSYSRAACRNTFTAGQYARGLATLINLRPELYGGASTRWVDFAWRGAESGTFANPFNTLAEGVTAVPAGGTVRVKAGSTPTPITITKCCTLRCFGGVVTVGR